MMSHRLHSTIVFSLGVLAASLCGCQNADNTWLYTGRDESPPAPAPSHPYVYPADAPAMDVGDLQRYLTRYQGKTVVLDVWAGWNRRCREEMISLTQLQTESGTNGRVQVVSCNLDSPALWKDHTVPILHGASANYPCLVIKKEAQGDLRNWLAHAWGNDLPARFIFGSDGQVRRAYFGNESIEACVADARGEASSPPPDAPIPEETVAAPTIEPEPQAVGTMEIDP